MRRQSSFSRTSLPPLPNGAPMATTKLAIPPFAKQALSQVAPILLVSLGALALLWWMAGAPWKRELLRLAGWETPEVATTDAATPASGAHGGQDAGHPDGHRVQLSPEKVAQAKIELTEVMKKRIRPEVMTPGQVNFDATRRLHIVSPVDCVVEQVLVEPGKTVKKGERLVVLQSDDVGLARDQIGRCEDDLKLARRELDYAKDILANVQQLLESLAKSPEYDAVIAAFNGKRLGVHREHLLGAYSKLNLARKTLEESSDLGTSGAVSGRLVQQRKSEREVAEAAFDSQCETTLFECLQEKDKAEAAASRAERMLEIAKANLSALLGGLQVEQPTGEAINLSELIVTAPIDGQIEPNIPVRYARLKEGTALLTVADASVLWITANVREREWNASRMKAGDVVQVRIPALGEQRFSTSVRFIGAEVSAETRTLPVVLEIANPDRMLKPGMSAWAALAVEEERDALVIPSSAVLRHEEQAFCFVNEGDARFRRVDLELGNESQGVLEVKKGLSVGEQIVAKGAFLLKSELLLEKEE